MYNTRTYMGVKIYPNKFSSDRTIYIIIILVREAIVLLNIRNIEVFSSASTVFIHLFVSRVQNKMAPLLLYVFCLIIGECMMYNG